MRPSNRSSQGRKSQADRHSSSLGDPSLSSNVERYSDGMYQAPNIYVICLLKVHEEIRLNHDNSALAISTEANESEEGLQTWKRFLVEIVVKPNNWKYYFPKLIVLADQLPDQKQNLSKPSHTSLLVALRKKWEQMSHTLGSYILSHILNTDGSLVPPWIPLLLLQVYASCTEPTESATMLWLPDQKLFQRHRSHKTDENDLLLAVYDKQNVLSSRWPPFLRMEQARKQVRTKDTAVFSAKFFKVPGRLHLMTVHVNI